MNIKNKDLNLLIRIENFLGTNFPRGSEGQDLAWDLCSLNERLIMQRQEHAAKTAKNDEFYTRFDDINFEINLAEHGYRPFFKDKVVYCNCDDPEESNFWKFFKARFNGLKLKKLISTHYDQEGKSSYKLEYDGERVVKTELEGNGDFRSPECVELLKESDIVVTNPPFSLFRDFIGLLMEYNKKFAIIGNKNAITYKEVFPLIKENKVWLGYSSPNEFITPNGEITKRVNGLCRWFTNLEIPKRHEPMLLGWKFEKGLEMGIYQKYDNYDAYNVDKVCQIPRDYDGVLGVPITFLDKYCPEQFEIVAFRKGEDGKDLVFTRERENSTVLSNPCSTAALGLITGAKHTICSDGRSRYGRIAIKKRNPST